MSQSKQSNPDPSDAVRTQLLSLSSVRTRLEFLFALLSAAGGVMVATGQDADSIALLAIFCAAFGFVFVDWLRIFELPPIGAYLAMGGAAIYCVQDFWGLQQRGEPQMASVALLLVLVQGVLILQRKSRRIMEQLAVFCLLEMVVAAIFNDAITYGLMMIPIAIIGGAAISLLGLVSMMESIDLTLDRPSRPAAKTRLGRLIRFIAGAMDCDPPQNRLVATASPESVLSIYSAAAAWSRYAVMTLAPAVILIAAAFFYVLPREIEPSRSTAARQSLVGFDDEIRLEQLGQVMQNSKTALKIKLTNQRTSQPYRVKNSFYLRGKVLESYDVDYSGTRPVAKWVSVNPNSISRRSKLPRLYRTPDPTDFNRYDDVLVDVTCETMSQPALFSVAPYHRHGDATDVVHAIDRWTLSRKFSDPPFPRISYEFGTRAFFRGNQTGWIAQAPEMERAMTSYRFDLRSAFSQQSQQPRRDYEQDLLSLDRTAVPTVVQMASEIVDSIPLSEWTQTRIARRLEQFLATDQRFSYTLKLDATPIPNVDPVEQFLSVDRRGHCQYFSSALALMLRSLEIPCRVVVGYRTSEYNGIGKYYIARQQHAHAWVEALVDRVEIPQAVNLAGQRPTERYWMRLDPTPGVSVIDQPDNQSVDGILNLANNIWEDYVVEMNRDRQNEDLVEAAGLVDIQTSYRGTLEALQRKLAQVRAGRLGGGRLSQSYKTPLGLLSMIAGGILLILMLRKIRLPDLVSRLLNRRAHGEPESAIQKPTVLFYTQTLQQLERVGIHRRKDETPTELCRRAGSAFSSLDILTDFFQRHRYGHATDSGADQLNGALAELTAEVDRELSAKR